MAGELVFVTGAAGFIGAQTVDAVLRAGYRVRGSVRRQAQIEQLQMCFGPEFGPMAEFVTVPDITKENAYDGLLDDVDYVLHVASPLAPETENYKRDHIQPAVCGTNTMLAAANKVKKIKKVVITGSIVDLIPFEGQPDGIPIKEDNGLKVDVSPDHDFKSAFDGYRASKILAAKATRQFVADHNPSFGVVTIHPTFVYGRNILQASPDGIAGTNAALLSTITGPTQPIVLSSCVHINDVAEAHVRALRPGISGPGKIEKFLLVGDNLKWPEVVSFVKANYPEFSVGEHQVQLEDRVSDASKAERVLGMRWKGWREQLRDVLNQQLTFQN